MSAAGVRAGLAAARASPRRKWGGGGETRAFKGPGGSAAGAAPAAEVRQGSCRLCGRERERVERNWLWYQVGK
jgi:hypothetical protein